MMKTRLMKGRPRLVPQEEFRRQNSTNLWIDDKESDITSVSSSTTTEGSVESEEDDDSMMTEEELEDTGDRDEDTDDDDDDDEEEDDDESRLGKTVTESPSDTTENTVLGYKEATPLFKAVNNEEWDSIVTFLETGSWGWKWSSLCAQLYQVSEKAAAAQVRTWVCMDGVNGEISRLPLHAAIYKEAPFKVIHILVKSYQKGVRSPDSEGNYPLHLAFQRAASLETMTYLMKEFPQAIHIRNDAGQLPTECGHANGISQLLNLCIGSTKTHVEKQLTNEKGNLEEDRKQLLEVTKELMNLKKIVAERERNMTKDNFLYQKQHLNTAISQLTKLKLDLDKHEDSVLKHHLVAEKKRMDGVLGELHKTKGELDKIKSEQILTVSHGNDGPTMKAISSPREGAAAGGAHQQVGEKKKKKKKTSSSKRPPGVVTNHHIYDDGMGDPREEAPPAAAAAYKDVVPVDMSSPPVSPVWSASGAQDSQLTNETDGTNPDEMRDPHDLGRIPMGDKSQSMPHSPRKHKTLGSRFKKKMNWRKDKQAPEAE